MVAAEAGISGESLYCALSPKGNPKLKTLVAVLETLGLRLSVEPEYPEASLCACVEGRGMLGVFHAPPTAQPVCLRAARITFSLQMNETFQAGRIETFVAVWARINDKVDRIPTGNWKQ